MSPPRERIQQARAAKDALRARFEREPWFRGVGVVPHNDTLGLRLNVSPEVELAPLALPREFEGLPLEIVRIEGYAKR